MLALGKARYRIRATEFKIIIINKQRRLRSRWTSSAQLVNTDEDIHGDLQILCFIDRIVSSIYWAPNDANFLEETRK
jgi:hypothetical protein